MSYTQEELKKISVKAKDIARQSGQVALSGFRTNVSVSKKGQIDLVTQYDLECETLIRKELLQAFPQHQIIGEEYEAQGEGELVWYVDPIDGTTNFAHGHPFFCVSLALWEQNIPLVGVIFAPALDVMWSGIKGQGAFRNEVRCQVSETPMLGDALCATGFAYNRWSTEDDNLAEYRAFLKRTQGVRRCGAAALDLALVSDGTYDVYWEQGLKPWDVAAGILFVQEAGGIVTNYSKRQDTLLNGEILASNGQLHDSSYELIAKTRHESGLS